MATVTPTRQVAGAQDQSVMQWDWTLTSTNTDGAGIQLPEHADVTWIARGTWGGATLKVQGSADNSNWIATGLSNAAGGTEAAVTGDKVVTTIERPLFIRPNLTTAGSGATVYVTALARRATPNRV